jgi:hypothetical protein
MAVVNRFVQLGRATEEIRKTRARMEDSRAQIRQHCIEHGCDPKYLGSLTDVSGYKDWSENADCGLVASGECWHRE